MNNNDQLYRLIHSLTPAEKRMFKIYSEPSADSKNKSNYNSLFNAINKWKKSPFTESEFLEKHANEEFAKNFAYEKHYLLHAILRVMRLKNNSGNPHFRFHENALDFYFLSQKGVTESAAELYLKLCESAELSGSLEAKLMLQPFYWNLHNRMEGGAEETWIKTKELIDQLTSERRALFISTRIGEIISNAIIKSNPEFERLIDESKQLLNYPNISLKAERKLSLVLLQYYSMINEHENAYQLADKMVQKIDAYVTGSYQKSLWLNEALHNLMEASACSGQWDAFRIALNRFRNLTFDNKLISSDNFSLLYANEIRYRIGVNQNKDSASILKEIETGMIQHKKTAAPFYFKLLQFQLARYFFFLKRYDDCLEIIRQTWTDPVWKQRLGMSLLESRSLEWMCHACTGNFSVLDSALLSLRRLIKNQSDPTEWTKPVLKCFDAIMKNGSLKGKSLQQTFKAWNTEEIPVNIRPSFQLIQSAVTA